MGNNSGKETYDEEDSEKPLEERLNLKTGEKWRMDLNVIYSAFLKNHYFTTLLETHRIAIIRRPETVKRIVEAMTAHYVKAKEVITKIGEPADHIFFLHKGAVNCFTLSGARTERVVAGGLFGEVDVMEGATYSLHRVVFKSGIVHIICKRKLQKIVEDSRQFYDFRNLQLLNGLSTEELDKLAPDVSCLAYKAGQEIVTKGSEPDFYCVSHGIVVDIPNATSKSPKETTRKNSTTSPNLVHESKESRKYVGPKGYFGEDCIFENKPFKHTYLAETDSVLFKFTRESFEERFGAPRLIVERRYSVTLKKQKEEMKKKIRQAKSLFIEESDSSPNIDFFECALCALDVVTPLNSPTPSPVKPMNSSSCSVDKLTACFANANANAKASSFSPITSPKPRAKVTSPQRSLSPINK